MPTTRVYSTHPSLRYSHTPSSQPWFQWSVSSVFKTAFVCIVCAFFLRLLYRLVSELSPTIKKPLVPFPQDQMPILCFIRIDLTGIPKFKTSRGVEVIIEDTEERRIATRYLPIINPIQPNSTHLSTIQNPRERLAQCLLTIASLHEMIVHLPQNQKITVRLEGASWKKEQGIEQKQSFTFKTFQVDKPTRYHLNVEGAREEKITELVGKKGFWRPAWDKASAYLSKKGLKINFSPEKPLFQDIEDSGMILEGRDQVYAAVKIVLKHSVAAKESLVLHYPAVDTQERKLGFDVLIRDWKTLYQLRYKSEFHEKGLFYIEGIRYYLYQPN